MQFIQKNGRRAAAFDLVLTKQNAYAIMTGAKTIEFRKFSEFYIKRLAIVTKDGKKQDISTDKEYQGRPIHCIHFHDYNQTWSLDVAIEAVDIMAIHPANNNYFHERGCYEMDSLINEVKDKEPHDEEVVWSFCIPIRKIIQTTLPLPDNHIPIIEIPDVLNLN